MTLHTTIGSLLPHDGKPPRKDRKVTIHPTSGESYDALLVGRDGKKKAIIQKDGGAPIPIAWNTPAERR